MPRLLRTLTLAAALAVLSGCSSATQSDPKVADPSKIDPRLKPADSGAGTQPNKGQGAIKGD